MKFILANCWATQQNARVQLMMTCHNTILVWHLIIPWNKWNRIQQALIAHLPWIIGPVHCINFCQVTTKCSSCSHLYSTNWFNIMCYLGERNSKNVTDNSTTYKTLSTTSNLKTKATALKNAGTVCISQC